MASKASHVIPNLDKVKIEGEGSCYLPSRLRYHILRLLKSQTLRLARYHILVLANQPIRSQD